MGFPPGTIIVPTSETARYSHFYRSLQGLVTPPGTKTLWSMGSLIAINLNKAVRDLSGEWVMIWGDDHTFPPDILLSLLAYDVDIVAPLCLDRRSPFQPAVCVWEESLGMYRRARLSEAPAAGLWEVPVIGMAGAVIKRHVFDVIKPPYFGHRVVQMGDHELIEGEDLWFCHKAAEAGFKCHIAVEHTIGHIFAGTVLPVYQGGQWRTRIDSAEGAVLATYDAGREILL